MRKALDKIFENKILSFLIPILISLALYLLFIFFGVAEDKLNGIISTPIVSAFWFFGVFFVIYIQVKNKRCPEGFLDFFELACTIFFGFASIALIIMFVSSGFRDFIPMTPAAPLTFTAISWAHSKRGR